MSNKTLNDLLDRKLDELTVREIIAVVDCYMDFKATGCWNWKQIVEEFREEDGEDSQ